MDTILIRWIVILFGVCVRSNLAKEKDFTASIKNETSESSVLNVESSRSFKPKRELDDFEFDSSTFDSPGFYHAKKINGLTSLEDEDDEDFSAFIPTSSFKVTRSNSQNLGIRGQNYEPTNFLPANYRSDSQPAQQSSDTQGNVYSNEDQSSFGHARQGNTALNNQVTTPYIQVNHPKYIPAKSSAFTGDTGYKPPAKIQFNPYPPITEFTSSIPIYSALTQLPIHAVPSNHHPIQQTVPQNLPYKPQFAQSLKNLQPTSKIYAPSHRHTQPHQQQFDSQFQNFGQNLYDNGQYTTASTVEINGEKLALPVLQLQTAPDYSGYIQALDTAPVIYSAESGLTIKTEPGYGVSFDFAKPKHTNSNQRSGTNVPFLNSANAGPIQVLPLQSASSSAQFPKFKGASISQFPSRGFSKIPNDYQEFKSQSQLHFDGNKNNNNNSPKNYQKPGFYSKPLEEIRTDVEVINKKKPIPPLPKADDDDDESAEDDSGEGQKNTDSYFPSNNDDDDEEVEELPRKYFKESELQSDFKPSKSFPFKEYDDKFGKQKKRPINIDDDDDDNADVNLAAKYRYLSKSENDDDDDDDDSAEVKESRYKKYPYHENLRSHSNDDDDEDEEESRNQETKDKSVEANYEHRNKKKSKPHKQRGRNYEEDFDETFRRKPSKPKLSHRSKGSTDQSETRHRYPSSYRKTDLPKVTKKNRHRTYRDETGEVESSTRGSTRNIAKLEKKSEDIDRSHSLLHSRGLKTPQVVWQDSYGIKDSRSEEVDGLPTYSKEEAAAMDSYGNARKPSAAIEKELTTKSSHKSIPSQPKEPANLYKLEEHGTSTSTSNPRNNWKSGNVKIKAIPTASYVRPSGKGIKSLAHTKQAFFNSELGRGEIFRNLKGI